eukprot:1728808-Pyramimonas_sp.AAC.1
MYLAKATANLPRTRVSSAHATATSVIGPAAIPTARSARGLHAATSPLVLSEALEVGQLAAGTRLSRHSAALPYH